MFATYDSHRSPVADFFAAPEQSLWTTVELVLNQTWFMVTFKKHHGDDACEATFDACKTVLHSDIHQVEHYVQSQNAGLIDLIEVLAITPSGINESDQWKMEALKAVWNAYEPTAPSVQAPILEMANGQKYRISGLGTKIDSLVNHSLRFVVRKN